MAVSSFFSWACRWTMTCGSPFMAHSFVDRGGKARRRAAAFAGGGPRARRASVAVGVGVAAGLEEEPGAALGLVDPHLDQAGRGDVAVLLAGLVRGAEVRCELLVVLLEL